MLSMGARSIMEKSDFIDHLNADLGTEFHSIVQYVSTR
jgi:hypothetical protein